MKVMWHIVFGLALGLGLLAANAATVNSAQAVEIVLNDVAPDRIERQRGHAAGRLELPNQPAGEDLDARLEAKGLKLGAPIFIRIFKKESEAEVWMKKGERFVLFATYPICHWSGTLGPKLEEGDRQNPEGLYSVTRRQLHRSGRWPRSLNIGFPNAFDRTLKRTGSYILIHGGCTSVGCYAMTDEAVREIYLLANRALAAGQPEIYVHAFPFHLTNSRLAGYASHQWYGFWGNLKQAYDAFAETRVPPKVAVCKDRYVVEAVAKYEQSAVRAVRQRGRRQGRKRLASFPPARCEIESVAVAMPELPARPPAERASGKLARPLETP
ncbi:MAG: hypothetical protein RLZ98_3151 [Pseudomonadota bacterium]|jgi:murein L,D-transpeptidase YafK